MQQPFRNTCYELIVWYYYSMVWISHQATDVWKATKTAERLVEQYMVRIETASTFGAAS